MFWNLSATSKNDFEHIFGLQTLSHLPRTVRSQLRSDEKLFWRSHIFEKKPFFFMKKQFFLMCFEIVLRMFWNHFDTIKYVYQHISKIKALSLKKEIFLGGNSMD